MPKRPRGQSFDGDEPTAALGLSDLSVLQHSRDAFIISMTNLQEAANHASSSALHYFNALTTAHTTIVTPPTAPENVRGFRQHHPDQPKRPINAYLLFCAARRETVKSDLGEGCRPQDIISELTARWARISGVEKKAWYGVYKKNLVAYHEEMRKFWLGTYPKRRARDTVSVGNPASLPVGSGSGEHTGLLSPDGGGLRTSEELIGPVDDGQSPCDRRDRTPTRRISVASLLGDSTHSGSFVVEIPDKECLTALPPPCSTDEQLGRVNHGLCLSGNAVSPAASVSFGGVPSVMGTVGIGHTGSEPGVEGVGEA